MPVLQNIKLFDCPECGYTYRGKDADIYNSLFTGYRRGECPGCNNVFEYELTEAHKRADRMARFGMLFTLPILFFGVILIEYDPRLLLLGVPPGFFWIYGSFRIMRNPIPKLHRVRVSWRDRE